MRTELTAERRLELFTSIKPEKTRRWLDEAIGDLGIQMLNRCVS
jgi:hypothetical protein